MAQYRSQRNGGRSTKNRAAEKSAAVFILLKQWLMVILYGSDRGKVRCRRRVHRNVGTEYCFCA